MSDPTDFTPKEQYQISLYKDPDALFSRALFRTLYYVIPSVGLVCYSLVTRDLSWGLVGYGLLLFRALYRLTILKRGLRTISSIISKFEARLQKQAVS